MFRYLVKFSKQGYIRYTSHLDMMRLFQRSFKRANIALAYSQGFHPHPKMSIAQPLSLGFTSVGEYIEVELQASREDIKEKLNAIMPEGMEILEVKPIKAGTKSLAALIEYGKYNITFIPEKKITEEGLNQIVQDFIAQDEIQAVKFQKKSNKETVMDLKPLVYEQNLKVYKRKDDNNRFMLTATIKTGSISNLNPDLLFKEFLKFSSLAILEGSIQIHRVDLYYADDNQLKQLSAI